MKRFTPEDDAAIRSAYKKLGCTTLAARLGRGPHSVWCRAVVLGVCKPRHEQAYRPFEEALVRDHYHDWGPKRIAKRLGRSPGSVQSKAIRMGVIAPAIAMPDLSDLGPLAACPLCGGSNWVHTPAGGIVCRGEDADGTPCPYVARGMAPHGLCPTPDQIAAAARRLLRFRPVPDDEDLAAVALLDVSVPLPDSRRIDDARKTGQLVFTDLYPNDDKED